MSEPLSELYSECESALRLFRFVKRAYDDLIADVPEEVTFDTTINIFVHQSLHRTLEAELTSKEAYALCAFIEGLREHRGGDLF
jgi:hypothetical protein